MEHGGASETAVGGLGITENGKAKSPREESMGIGVWAAVYIESVRLNCMYMLILVGPPPIKIPSLRWFDGG